MRKIKWIGTSAFKEDIENLIENNEIVFIEFEYYIVLMRIIDTLRALNLNYTTDLFEADSLEWNYSDPKNLTLLKDEMVKNPTDRYYLEIRPKEKYYTCCNDWAMSRTLKKNRDKAVLVTTMSYARD